MRTLSLLGSTGSIGRNVLEVVRKFPERFRIAGLSAGSNVALLAEQVQEFNPRVISIGREELIPTLCNLLPAKYRDRVCCEQEGNCAVATLAETEMVVSSMVGAVGLVPTLAAIEAGKDIGLANKETLVMAGQLVMGSVHKHGVKLLPIDSEHSAIFQALEAGRREDLANILLTASGGPFRTWSEDSLAMATPDQALAHPNWDMGRKISIDSATLMNKGLEVIEARWLFDVPPEKIRVVVHPQSIVHSLVEYCDGSVVGQLGIPDMKIPIAYALSYPERMDLGLSRLSLTQCGDLSFEKPDFKRFPALKIAFEALESGGVAPAVLNAANEVAVDSFLDKQIAFTHIPLVVRDTLLQSSGGDEMVLDDILHADREARVKALDIIAKISIA